MDSLSNFWNQISLQIGSRAFTWGDLITVLIIVVVAIVFNSLVTSYFLPRYFERETVVTPNRRGIKIVVASVIGLLALLGIVELFGLNYALLDTEHWHLRLVHLLQVALVIQLARFGDWLAAKAVIYNYRRSRGERGKTELPKIGEKDRKTASRLVRYAVYTFAFLTILQGFPQLDIQLFSYQQYHFHLSNLCWAIFIFLLAQLLAWILTQVILIRYFRNKQINLGSQYAINQLLKYIIYVLAIVMALDSLGIQMTVIWGGAAALLVRVGLGLQQTFNDLISGVILLSERTVEVGDVIELNGSVGTVRKIGLRTSIVESLDNISVIVPNSKLTIDKVINWSHVDEKARFHVAVGVAYGSDTKLVKQLLLEVARAYPQVLEFPAPQVRMVDFGASSLDFSLLFWSRNLLIIEDVKSELRMGIDQAFRENDITIPFPQMDVWMKKEEQPPNPSNPGVERPR